MKSGLPQIIEKPSLRCVLCGLWRWESNFEKFYPFKMGIRTCRGRKGLPLYCPPQLLSEVDEETRKVLLSLRKKLIEALKKSLMVLEMEVLIWDEIETNNQVEDIGLNLTQETGSSVMTTWETESLLDDVSPLDIPETKETRSELE